MNKFAEDQSSNIIWKTLLNVFQCTDQSSKEKPLQNPHSYAFRTIGGRNLSSSFVFLSLKKNEYRVCRNKRSPWNKCPPKRVIFQRGEYMKPMGFDGWFFQRGEYIKPMGFDGWFFQRGEYMKPMGFDGWFFQRGEYIKPMGFDGWFFKGGSTWNRWVLMGGFSKGGVHETDGFWWVWEIFCASKN